jgi:hypothetical protein
MLGISPPEICVSTQRCTSPSTLFGVVGPIEGNVSQRSAVVNRWNSWVKLVGEEELTTAECCGIVSPIGLDELTHPCCPCS